MDHAIAQRVDVVALSGDVVDHSNSFYEAVGPLERGLRKLADAGVTTVAVAGNHDYHVLPRLARMFDAESFRLLGAGGEWERTTITSRGGERLHVDGWSFPAEHVLDDPLASYDPPRPDGDTPVLGLLHADLDASGSQYAPVSLADLRSRQLSLWLLGHVHAHKLHPALHGPSVLYPGSPQAMDPGEVGVHGAWLVDLRPLATVEPCLNPLASVRYEELDVDVDGVDDVEELHSRVYNRLRSGVAELVDEAGGSLRCLSLRLRIVGATSLHRIIEHELRNVPRDFERQEGAAAVYVERITAATRPARDLDVLARGSDAVARLARLANDLATGALGEGTATLLDGARNVAAVLLDARQYRPVDGLGETLDERSVQAATEQQALNLLDELLAQKEQA